MPRRRRRQEEDLVHAAVEALEDEIRCWKERERPYSGGMVTLTRWPLSRIDGPIGPAEFDAQATQTIEHIDLPKNEVPYFLRYRGMEAAIKKICELQA